MVSMCVGVCFFGFYLFCFDIFIKKERKGMELGVWGSREELVDGKS